MELICDYREKSIYNKLTKITSTNDKYKDISIKTENLSLGDFAFGNIIIERKTHQDLASSILDGRYKEQCFRLEEYRNENPDVKIIYFIEGNFDLFFNSHNIDKDKLISCIISFIYEKGFSVILTKHMNETCDFLIKFSHKYYNKYNICENNKTINNGNLENLYKQQKKKNSQINKKNIGIIMLCNVPNISLHLAIQLLEPFNNDIYKFIHEIRTNDEYLNTIKIKGKGDKTRKLNKNIIECLREYFIVKEDLVEDLDLENHVES